MKLISLWAGVILTFCSFSIHAESSHLAQALTHAEAAVKATDGKTSAEHAEAAKPHAKTVQEHLTSAIVSLDSVIEHGKLGHNDLAKKAAEEAVTHLKAAQ